MRTYYGGPISAFVTRPKRLACMCKGRLYRWNFRPGKSETHTVVVQLKNDAAVAVSELWTTDIFLISKIIYSK